MTDRIMKKRLPVKDTVTDEQRDKWAKEFQDIINEIQTKQQDLDVDMARNINKHFGDLR